MGIMAIGNAKLPMTSKRGKCQKSSSLHMPKKELAPLNKNLSQIKNRSSSSRIVV